VNTIHLAFNKRATCRWGSFAAAAILAFGSASWFQAASADDPPQKAAAPAAKSASDAQRPAAVADKPTAVVGKSAAQRPLDLTAPPVERVLTPQEMRSFVEEPTQEEDAPPEDVTVTGPHYLEPVPNGAFGAVPWALMHPLQAWRIFTPITN
jgi:hypothetical protein